jgi:hypothetical protein
MEKRKVKSALLASFILAIVGCTNTVPNNTLSGQPEISVPVDFQDLDNEYKSALKSVPDQYKNKFGIKTLATNYLERKFLRWVYDTPSGPKLVKELLYANYKYHDQLCEVLGNVPGLYDDIILVTEVSDRRSFDTTFDEYINFLKDCAAPPTLGEFKVNQINPGFQTNPKVAMDNNGDFVVVWQKYGNNGDNYEPGIFARRYNSQGAPVGGQFRVDNNTTFNSGKHPDIAIDADGDFVITWEANPSSESSTGTDIFAKKYNSNGTIAKNTFVVNSFRSTEQKNPTVAMDDQGDFVIAWQSYGQEANYGSYYGYQYGSSIQAQRYFNTSQRNGTEFRVNTTTTRYQTNPDVAMDSSGDFVITWENETLDPENGYNQDIFAQRYDSNGNKPEINGSEFTVNTNTLLDQITPGIAMDSAGDFAITWQSNNSDGNPDIFAQRYDSNGNKPEINGSEFTVNTNTVDSQVNPDIAMDDQGDFVITWQSLNQDPDGSKYGVFAQRYDSNGNKPEINGGEFLVNTSTSRGQMFPAVAEDSAGDFIAVWQSGHSSTNKYGVYGKRYNTNGDPFLLNRIPNNQGR